MDLGHCHFKGGKGESGSTTTRNIPEQSGNEKALETFLLDSSSLGGNMAPYMYQAFAGSLNDSFNPNFGSLYDEVSKDNRIDLTQYGQALQGELDDYKSKMGAALNEYNDVMDSQKSLWSQLVNGELPTAYANARQAALNADLKGTVGSAINNLASRGVINSGVGNKAMDDISQSASDTLAKMYRDDLQTEASLLGQQGTYAGNRYGTNAGNAQNIYDSASKALGDYVDRSIAERSNRLSNAATAQSASMEPATQYLNYAGQLQTPVSNLYNTMYSGRMGTGSTTTTQDDGGSGVWSAVGGIGSALLMCFTGETLVTTPDGYKEIANIQEGDTVLSVHNGEIVPKKVVRTYGPNVREIVEVRFDNGTVWHCTKGQRYYDGKHFGYVDYGVIPAMVYQGNDSQIVSVKGKGDVANVYDIKLEGFAGDNVFFANDVAAEGMGD
jgi:hypothetical protein